MAARGFIELLRIAQRGRSKYQHNVANETSWSGVAFEIDQNYFVVPLGQVSEVIPLPYCTPVPHTMPWHKGLANIRGSLFSIVDLNYFFTDQPCDPVIAKKVFCIRDEQSFCGVLLNRVLGVQHFNEQSYFSQINDLDANIARFCQGYFRANGRNWYVFMLNQLLHDERFMNVSA